MPPIAPEFNLQSYDFDLPEDLIAQNPVDKRGQSRLLLLNRTNGQIQDLLFTDFPILLPPGALVVVNNSQVLPARMIGHKDSGGRVEFLLLTPLALITEKIHNDGHKSAPVLGLLKASKAPRQGEKMFFPGFDLEVLEKKDFGQALVQLTWQGELAKHFLQQGHMPLPPYIRREATREDHTRYQTIYACQEKLGSVAAPTAGLHFTPEIVAGLKAQDIQITEVTLYVGYGTFSPVRASDIRQHVMHPEYAEVSAGTAQAIAQAKTEGRPIVAVGTTTTRTLESMVTTLGRIAPFQGWTDIFIRPGYEFKVVDQLLTNFHLPRSSLIIMVSTLAGRHRILETYAHAIKQGYRFFSYGDAMLIR